MADWYVYQHGGDPLGPWSTDTVADAILAGKLPPDVWVAAPGGPRWLRALDVPVIGRLVEGVPTKPRRRASGLRLIPAAFTPEDHRPFFGATTMIVKDDEIHFTDAPATTRKGPPLSRADDTARMPAIFPFAARAADDEQVTEIAVHAGVAEDEPSSDRDPRMAEARRAAHRKG